MKRRLTACTFDSGLCSNLNQDTDDNFDWTLTSEGTPTSNTGPDTGFGGEGAFMFIEANDQAEGNVATVTSSATGCALYIDYHMYGGGIGSLTVSSRNAGNDASWVPVWTKEGDQGDSWQATAVYFASGSYYRVTATRGGGIRGDIAIDNLNLVACTPAPTLAPTNVGEYPICNFTAGFCDWTQDADDNFDWALTSEGTPTTNTGPSAGAGHGRGAFIHVEASDQTEGAYAAITSSVTGCGLYVDYHMYGGGIGSLTVSAKDVAEGEDAAWVPVWTKEGDQGDSWQAATVYSAVGSYYQVTATRGGGNRGDIAIDNLNLIWCTDAPTATPTNVGDTNMPTASPTAAPTAVPTIDPAAEGACQGVIITTEVAYISWAVGMWTLDETRSCDSMPVYYKAMSDGLLRYFGYPSGGGVGYMIQYESDLCTTTGLAYSDDRTPSDLSEAEGTWKYWDGSSWIIDSTFTASCNPTAAPTSAPTSGPTAAPTLPTTAPTAIPTNEGDTHSPTALPTASPTIAPTSEPTMDPISNWLLLKIRCANSACDTANGGCTITLSDDFVMGLYSGQIEFSGKAITIWGQEKVLDAGRGGQIFNGYGADSFLELHDAVLQNGSVGAIVAAYANVEIHGTTFLNNTSDMWDSRCGSCYEASAPICSSSSDCSDGQQCINTCGSGNWGQGGAMITTHANVEIYDSTFQANTASTAGAIRAFYGTTEIYDTTFESNRALDTAGALFVYEGTMMSYGNIFESNRAGTGGG
jgi:hypothetical protein